MLCILPLSSVVYCYYFGFAQELDLKMADICRLCLFSTGIKKETLFLHVVANLEESSIEDLDNKKKEMLQLVFPTMNLNVGSDLKLCNECSRMLVAVYEFKSACLHHNRFPKNSNSITEGKCLLCRESLQMVQRANNEEDTIYMNLMLEKCLPEMQIEDTSKQCRKCMETLKDSYNFVIKCIETEDCIKTYMIMKGLTSLNEINLSDVIEFSSGKKEKTVARSEENPPLYVPPIRTDTVHQTSADVKEETTHSIVSEEIDIKADKEPECPPAYPRKEDNVSTYKCKHCSFTAHTVEDINYHKEVIHENRNAVSVIPQRNPIKCVNYVLKTMTEDELNQHNNKTQEMQLKPVPEATSQTIIKCDKCDYQNARKLLVKKHQLVHREKNINCELCDFKTNTMGGLRKHQLQHGVKTHKCSFEHCSFETKYKNYLRKHEKCHKDTSAMKKYKCPHCSFVSIHDTSVRKHVRRIHENIPEQRRRIPYTCDICRYSTHRKTALLSHILKHNNPTEVETFKCFSCLYESKSKYGLEMHIKVKHSRFSLKCEVCHFQTKYKRLLVEHMLCHKPPSEVPKYKCEKCAYETTLKRYLLQHEKVHQDPATLRLLMCDVCSYTTQRRNYLRNHMATHDRELDKGQGKLYKTYQRFGVVQKEIKLKNNN